MRKWQKIALKVVGNFLVIAFAGLVVVTRNEAHKLVSHPPEVRRPMTATPADYGLPYEDVTVMTADGLHLVGWYLPSHNRAAVIVLHGFRGDRTDLLPTGVLLHRHGYGVLLASFRAHDRSEGELITLGKNHLEDIAAWHQYLLARREVDPARVGLLGESLGGALAIQYAAHNPNIHALVLDSVMASFDDALDIAVHNHTILPSFPVSSLLTFWAERETGVDSVQIDPLAWISQISPRPVLILQGGADNRIPLESGQTLFLAAGEPKELWYEPEATHHGFDEEPFCAKFEQRVVGFFDRYLLDR